MRRLADSRNFIHANAWRCCIWISPVAQSVRSVRDPP
jgi:hypothetical protein